ncbi:MAG: glycosyltransferase family 2 protein [Pseudomonadota bacterium]
MTEAVEGYIESLSGGVVRGWVWRPDAGDNPLVVTAKLRDTVLGMCRADQFRDDLAAMDKRGGACGFSIALSPDALERARKHLSTAPDTVTLDFFVELFSDGRAHGRTLWRSLPHKAFRQLYDTDRPNEGGPAQTFLGVLDRVDDTAISGWFCVPSSGVDGPVAVELFLDEVWVDTTVAGNPSLSQQLGGRLSGGAPLTKTMRFRFKTPDELRDGRLHTLSVGIVGQTISLIDKPLTVRMKPKREADGFAMPPIDGDGEAGAPAADGPRRGQYERWIEATEPARAPSGTHAAVTVLVESRTGTSAERRAIDTTLSAIAAQEGAAAKAIVYGPSAAPGKRTFGAALEEADGPYIALCKAGDILATHALMELVAKASAHPEASMVLADDDVLDRTDMRRRPRFKTAYCADRALTDDVFGGITLLRTARARAVMDDSPRPLDGTTLAIKLARREGAKSVLHLPRVLAHRRLASLQEARWQQPFIAALLAAEAGAQTPPRLVETAGRRVIWPQPPAGQVMSIIIPTKDRADLFEPLVMALLAQGADRAIEIIIVDNGSEAPETFAALRRLQRDDRVTALQMPGPFNFSALNNAAVRAAKGNLLVFMNNDIAEPAPGLLDELARQASRPDVGVVGARLSYPDGTNQHCGVMLGIGDVASHILRTHAHLGTADHGRFRHVQTVSAVTAALMAMRRAVFEQVSGFDEALSVAYNDVDLCLRVNAATGLRTLYTPFARAYHRESQSRGHDTSPEKRARLDREKALMVSRWGERLLNDPYLSPNHSLKSRDLEVAVPPRHGDRDAPFRLPETRPSQAAE